MTKNPINLGFILFIITMIIFFAVYYFFAGINYFDISLKINAFLLPVIYCGFAFFSVKEYWKQNGTINFKEAFKRAFLPMFVGGFLSILSIFIFLNYVDAGAKDLLNHQYIERQKSELVSEYTKAKSILKHDADKQELEKNYQKRLESFSPENLKNKDIFNAKFFLIYFSAIFMFYLVLSIFFGAFFRSRSAK